MKKLLIVVGVLVLAFIAVEYSRSDFREFSERREDWFRRCSAYVGSTATIKDVDRAAVCQRELDELVAYAERKGWTK